MKIVHRSMTILMTAAAMLVSLHTARGDVLELKNGQVVNGTYVGGTAGTLRFQPAKGALVGTAVGSIDDGSTGAGKGAAIGAARAEYGAMCTSVDAMNVELKL